MQLFSQTNWRQISTSAIFFSLLLLIGATVLFSSEGVRAKLASQSQSASGEKRRRAAFVPGEVIVRFKKDRAFEGIRQLRLPASDNAPTGNRLGATAPSEGEIPVTVERFEGSEIVDGLRIARSAPGDTLKAIAAFKARGDVLYAEPNYILHLDATTPNDPQFGSLYGMSLIGAPQAWDTTQGSSSIVVAVIDEGVDIGHEDLAANIWTNPMPGSIAGITGDLHGYNFIDNTGTFPAETHATHVAGIAGAVGNNNTGVVGVNWHVGLMSLRFISEATGQGSETDSIKAYNYVKQMRDLWSSSGHTNGANIRVVNASYGGGGYSQATADAINALGQSGVLFVAAAGNETTDTDLTPHYPSGYALPNVISVASTTSADTLSSFSNFGVHSVLMGAPGSGIVSTLPGNQYGSRDGTSMATPHVSGAAALLCAANSNLTVNQLRALLAFNGDNIAALQGKSLTGRRLNVSKSLQAMNEGDTTPPGPVGGLNISSQSGRNVTVSWNASGDDGAAGQASLYDISFIDQTSGAVIPLTTVAPAASGAPQSVSVNIPYRHVGGTIHVREFDNVGNEGTPVTVGVTVPLNAADPYTTALNSPASLSTGGTATGLTGDDKYLENYQLPFSFPFFGQTYNSVTISTNGNLYFSPPPKRANGDADDVPSSTADLSLRKMIAGMWDDLDLTTSRRADAGVYVVQPDTARIIFRWQGVQFDDGGPINFEIELRSDGAITTRYGAGNTNLFPVVGISGGEPDPYVIDALTSETSTKTLTNAQSAVFAPRTDCTFSLSATSQNFAFGGSSSVNVTTQNGCLWTAISNAPWITITGGASGSGNGTVNYSVAANPAAARSATMTIAGATFTVNQDAAPGPPPNTAQFSSSTYSVQEDCTTVTITVNRTGDTSGAASVDYNTSDGTATERKDYITALGRLQFAAAETSKSIVILINEDSYVEGNETFNVNLSNPSGMTLGTPAVATVTIIDDPSEPAANPIDDPRTYVCQNYHDFLNRHPDLGGWDFWTNQITACGTDAGCIEVRRASVSASFFLSIEFQETGYLVERTFKVSYGDNPGTSTFPTPHSLLVPIVRFNEFLSDTQQITKGVIVLQPGWEQLLESNKQAFFADFVQRSSFTSKYPNSTTPAQFVDLLFNNTGITPSASERSAAINEFGGASDISNVMARSKALRDVAENATLATAESNRAFVLMEYVGYLRRNPNDPQDTDYTGYDFWLTKLNQFGGNYINAEMVKAFISSIEYRQRFGP